MSSRPHIIERALQRTCDVIVNSRSNQEPKSKAKRQPDGVSTIGLLLEIPSVELIQRQLHAYLASNQSNISLRIDVHARRKAGPEKGEHGAQQEVLLERWTVKHHRDNCDGHPTDAAANKRMYKQITSMLRTLHSFSRMIPGFQHFKSVMRDPSVASRFEIDYTLFVSVHGVWEPVQRTPEPSKTGASATTPIKCLHELTFRGSDMVELFKMPDILTPYGDIIVIVEYLNAISPLETILACQSQPMVIPQPYAAAQDPVASAHRRRSQSSAVTFSEADPHTHPHQTLPLHPHQTLPLQIPSNAGMHTVGGMGRARSRSEQIYSRSEGSDGLHFPAKYGGRQEFAPSRSQATRELGSLEEFHQRNRLTELTNTPPFAISQPQYSLDKHPTNASGPSSSSVSPPFPRQNPPLSLISSSPQDLRIGISNEVTGEMSLLARKHRSWGGNLGVAMESLPVSPFERSHIFEALDDLNSGLMQNDTMGGSGSILGSATAHNYAPSSQVDDEDFELPFACQLDISPSPRETNQNGTVSSSIQEVGSFVRLVEKAPELNIFMKSEIGVAESDTARKKSLEDELEECKFFLGSL